MKKAVNLSAVIVFVWLSLVLSGVRTVDFASNFIINRKIRLTFYLFIFFFIFVGLETVLEHIKEKEK